MRPGPSVHTRAVSPDKPHQHMEASSRPALTRPRSPPAESSYPNLQDSDKNDATHHARAGGPRHPQMPPGRPHAHAHPGLHRPPRGPHAPGTSAHTLSTHPSPATVRRSRRGAAGPSDTLTPPRPPRPSPHPERRRPQDPRLRRHSRASRRHGGCPPPPPTLLHSERPAPAPPPAPPSACICRPLLHPHPTPLTPIPLCPPLPPLHAAVLPVRADPVSSVERRPPPPPPPTPVGFARTLAITTSEAASHTLRHTHAHIVAIP
jgi:hypothetical protein